MALTIREIEAAIMAKDGNITEVAQALGVSRVALYKRLDKSPQLQEALNEARRNARYELVDIAQSVIRDKLNEKDLTAAIYVLKSQGKREGWSERVEITGDNGGPLTWQHVVAEARKNIDSSDPYA